MYDHFGQGIGNVEATMPIDRVALGPLGYVI